MALDSFTLRATNETEALSIASSATVFTKLSFRPPGQLWLFAQTSNCLITKYNFVYAKRLCTQRLVWKNLLSLLLYSEQKTLCQSRAPRGTKTTAETFVSKRTKHTAGLANAYWRARPNHKCESPRRERRVASRAPRAARTVPEIVFTTRRDVRRRLPFSKFRLFWPTSLVTSRYDRSPYDWLSIFFFNETQSCNMHVRIENLQNVSLQKIAIYDLQKLQETKFVQHVAQ